MKEFVNKFFNYLAQFCNIKRIRTSPYHPQINSQTETIVQTMINMLKTAARNKSMKNWISQWKVRPLRKVTSRWAKKNNQLYQIMLATSWETKSVWNKKDNIKTWGKYQAPVCDKTVKQQQWSHRPEKEARIHYNIMTNASVNSASVKLDEWAPHTNDRRNNSGKARNHERINDQCKTGNKMNDQWWQPQGFISVLTSISSWWSLHKNEVLIFIW